MNIETRIIEPEPVPPPPPVKEIVLALTPEEAMKLRTLVFNGHDYRSRIQEALEAESYHFSAGIPDGVQEFMDQLRAHLISEGFETA